MNRHRRLICTAVASTVSFLVAPASVYGQASIEPLENEVVRVTLISGDVLTGVLISRVGGAVVLQHPTLGEITLPQANVEGIQSLAEWNAEQEAANAEGAAEAAADAPVEEVIEDAGPPPWDIRLELGINGSSGNTDNQNIRFATLATRETERGKTDLSMIYRYAEEDSNKTEDNFFARARQSWKFKESPRWSYYVEGTYESDEFQDWTDRMTVIGGLGYRFIDQENEKLDGRLGIGGTQRWGSDDDSWDTNLQVAADYSKKINDRVAFTASAEYLPDIEDLTDARLRGVAALEVKLNKDGNWLMKLGVEDRYDSTPGDAKHNDFYYGISLVMAF